jgi:hypothetical protein
MMIDCGRCEMRGIGCRDCVIAAVESRNVTGYLPEAEVRALGVLADAGLVPPLRLTIAGTSPPIRGTDLDLDGLPRGQSMVIVA